MNRKVAAGIASMMQKHLERNPGSDTLEELTQFVLDNADENLGLDENLHNLVALHQKQAPKAHRDFTMEMK